MDILTNLSLFSGVGGLDLAAKWTERIRTVCYVENEKYAQAVIQSRIRSKDLDDAPIWDDVTLFDGRPWNGLVDIVSGGFPCQDVSFAGRRAGLKPGTRSGLWNHFARIIREVRPRFVLVENVPGLLSMGLGRVFGDLAEMGFDAKWGVWGACAVSASHSRERVFCVANSHSFGCRTQRKNQAQIPSTAIIVSGNKRDRKNPWENEPRLGRVADVVADRVDRLRCCGNGVVPQQALPAWEEILKLAGVNNASTEHHP